MLINYASQSSWGVAKANAIILSCLMKVSFGTEKVKRLPTLRSMLVVQPGTQTSELPVLSGSEFRQPLRKGREGSGNQKMDCYELETLLTKDSLFEKSKPFPMALSYGSLWNIFQDHTKESLKIELKEKSFFFFFFF